MNINGLFYGDSVVINDNGHEKVVDVYGFSEDKRALVYINKDDKAKFVTDEQIIKKLDEENYCYIKGFD